MKSYSASMTIEASLSLSLFILAMVMLMTPLLILNRSIKISTILEKNARSISMYKYLEHYGIMKTAVQDIPNIEEILAVGETALEDLILPNEVNMEGMQNIRSWKSRITKEEILLNLEYEELIPLSIIDKKSIYQQIIAHRRAWIGVKGARWEKDAEEEKEEEETVYVIDGPSKVYHKSRDCTYISNEFIRSSAVALEGSEAKYGGKFSPCKACKPSKNSAVVYYTEAGRRYHSSTDCPAMRSSVHEIPLSQAISEGRHACPRCGG